MDTWNLGKQSTLAAIRPQLIENCLFTCFVVHGVHEAGKAGARGMGTCSFLQHSGAQQHNKYVIAEDYIYYGSIYEVMSSLPRSKQVGVPSAYTADRNPPTAYLQQTNLFATYRLYCT